VNGGDGAPSIGPAMTRNKRRTVLIALALAALVGSTTASAADPVDGLQGTWRGPWYLGMTSGTAALVLSGDPLSGGTLQLVNHEKFGDQPLPLEDLAYDGLQLRFRVRGADGRLLVADWPATPTARTLKAFVSYGGYKLRLELTRVDR